MDIWDGIIVGAAAAAIGSIIAYKFISNPPEGGGQPVQPAQLGYNATSGGVPAPIYVIPVNPPSNMAPMQQTTPITEAAYNQGCVPFEHAFGPAVNQPTTEENSALLPQ
jgi:hypothetical protein